MNTLPNHGRIACTRCYSSEHVNFDETRCTEGRWRITANPLAWGNPHAEVIVLGFSKGPTQAGSLAHVPHNEIAYKGRRSNVGKILSYVGLLPVAEGEDPAKRVAREIATEDGRFHFGSLIRCTVERYEDETDTWKGSGGGMLDHFVSTSFGERVARNCTSQFLSQLPAETRLIIMFGLGSRLNYVQSSFELFRAVRKGSWKWLNEVAYTDGKVTVVHVEHFASQGALIPHWMGADGHRRGRYGLQARDAVGITMGKITDSSGREIVSAKSSTAQRERKERVSEKLSPGVGVGAIHVTRLPENSMKSTAVTDAILHSNYQVRKETVKLREFCSPSGKTIYVINSTTSINQISIMVHPGLSSASLRDLNGVSSVSTEHRYHSGMSMFPARINQGIKATTYGWKITIDTVGDVRAFLLAFDALPEFSDH